MEVLLITFFAIAFVMLLKLSGKTRQERLLDALPGPAGLPVIGSFFDVFQTRQNYLGLSVENEAKFGPIYKTWIGSTPIVHISKPHHVEAILTAKGITRQPERNSLISKSLKVHPFNSFKNKNLLSSAFNSKSAQAIIDVTSKNCDILVDALDKKLNENNVLDYENVSLCVTDCICEIVLGVNPHTQDGQNLSFASSLLKLNKLAEKNQKVRFYSDFLFRMTSFGKDYHSHLNTVLDFIDKIIRERENEVKKVDNRENILNDLLVYNGLYNMADIKNEIFNVIHTAVDSIDRFIYWAIYVLGHDTHVQERIHQEIKTVSAKKANASLTIKDLQKMTYLDRVIKETLRLFPPHPFIVRELERDTTIGKYLIPHGTTICIQVANLHRDPASFPNPGKFDPDNFHPRKTEKRPRFAYNPFGISDGVCIAQKPTEVIQRILVTSLVRAFKIETIDKIGGGPDLFVGKIKQDKSDVKFLLLRRKE